MLAIVALLCAGTIFTGCDDDNDNDEGISLKSFGPSPVALGGKVTFIGSQLDKITEIVFPGNYSVTSFEEHTASKIVAIAPSDTTYASAGLVTLKYNGGELVTKTKIGYSQSAQILSLSPAAVKPGNKLAIQGTYLSVVEKVVLPGAVVDAENFVSHSNGTIEIMVPNEAQSGKVQVFDGTNYIYSEGELTVSVPKFTSFSKNSDITPGKDEITINGTDLDLVTSLTFANGVEVTDLKATEKTIVFTYPIDGQGDITLNVASGLQIPTSEITTIAPVIDLFGWDGTNKQQAETQDYFLGSEIVFTGKNLNLVKTLKFGNGSTNEFVVNSEGTQITAKIPGTATDTQKCLEIVENSAEQNWGACYTSWKNAFFITAESYAGIEQIVGLATHQWGSNAYGSMQLSNDKASFKAFLGGSEPVDFWAAIELNGKDVLADFKANGYIDVPLSNVLSCPVKIKLTNGTELSVDCASWDDWSTGSAVKMKATDLVNFPVVTEFPAGEFAGHLVEIKGHNFTNDTKFEFVNAKGSTEVTAKGLNNGNSYYITLPQSLSGTYDLKASDANGSSILAGVNVAGSMAVLFEGDHTLNWDKTLGAWDLTGVSKLQITFNGSYSGWLGILFQNMAGNNLWSGQKDFGPADGEYTIELSGEDIDAAKLGTDWYICGGTSGSCTVTKVVAIF